MLTFEEYVAEVKAIPYGKKVGNNVYVLWPDLKNAAPVLGSLLSPMGNVGETTLIKFFLDNYKVSFLQYPDFFDHPHPALHSSETEFKQIERDKAAMSRADFSRPVQLLLKHRLLSKNKTLPNTGIGHTVEGNG